MNLNDFWCTSNCLDARNHTDTMLSRFVVDLNCEQHERETKSLIPNAAVHSSMTHVFHIRTLIRKAPAHRTEISNNVEAAKRSDQPCDIWIIINHNNNNNKTDWHTEVVCALSHIQFIKSEQPKRLLLGCRSLTVCEVNLKRLQLWVYSIREN